MILEIDFSANVKNKTFFEVATRDTYVATYEATYVSTKN